MIETLLFIICLLVFLIAILLYLLGGLKSLFKRDGRKPSGKLLRYGLLSLSLALVLTMFSQVRATTPKLKADSGQGIAELIKVELNGREEWISVRGQDRENPVLLFLAGGPGGSQLGAVRRNLAALEEDYIIVNWEQPGSGKSYDAIDLDNLSPQVYIDDGLSLTKYLRERFQQDKIYLMGESWGSALGIFMIKEAPELYYGFIGTGQMVAFEETEKRCYDQALRLAEEKKDTKKVKALEKQGPPPYEKGQIALKSAEYLQYLSDEMTKNPKIHNRGYETLSDLASPEYGILDRINFFRGLLTTFSKVYPQLYEYDLRQTHTDLEVPVYFILGRHDLNAPPELAVSYYEQISGPDKKLIWFEHSGHSPWINEYDLFCQTTKELFTHHEQKKAD